MWDRDKIGAKHSPLGSGVGLPRRGETGGVTRIVDKMLVGAKQSPLGSGEGLPRRGETGGVTRMVRSTLLWDLIGRQTAKEGVLQ